MSFWLWVLLALYLLIGFFVAAFAMGIGRGNDGSMRAKIRLAIVVIVNFLLWPLLLLYVLGVKTADSGEGSVKQPPDDDPES